MRVDEAARYFGVPESALREMLKAGFLPGRKVAGEWDINYSVLQTALTLLSSLRHSVGPGGARPGQDSPGIKFPTTLPNPAVGAEDEIGVILAVADEDDALAIV